MKLIDRPKAKQENQTEGRIRSRRDGIGVFFRKMKKRGRKLDGQTRRSEKEGGTMRLDQ